MVEYGRALYYPYISFTSARDSWLKVAALYYDNLHRILPEGYVLRDSPLAQELQQELGFLQGESPREAVAELAPEFICYAQQHLTVPGLATVGVVIAGVAWGPEKSCGKAEGPSRSAGILRFGSSRGSAS